MTLGKVLCSLGFHKYMDLQRDNERLGQEAVEECVRCNKFRCVYRLMWSKEGPMHPRVQHHV